MRPIVKKNIWLVLQVYLNGLFSPLLSSETLSFQFLMPFCPSRQRSLFHLDPADSSPATGIRFHLAYIYTVCNLAVSLCCVTTAMPLVYSTKITILHSICIWIAGHLAYSTTWFFLLSSHEIRFDSIYFLKSCSWSYCAQFIGACYLKKNKKTLSSESCIKMQ